MEWLKWLVQATHVRRIKERIHNPPLLIGCSFFSFISRPTVISWKEMKSAICMYVCMYVLFFFIYRYVVCIFYLLYSALFSRCLIFKVFADLVLNKKKFALELICYFGRLGLRFTEPRKNIIQSWQSSKN